MSVILLEVRLSHSINRQRFINLAQLRWLANMFATIMILDTILGYFVCIVLMKCNANDFNQDITGFLLAFTIFLLHLELMSYEH